MSVPLENLLQSPALWRAGGTAGVRRSVIPSGFEVLDAQLPGNGWPHPALIEVLYERPGIGELSLFLPALRYLSESQQGEVPSSSLSRLRERAGVRAPVIAWLNPPHLPYPPALAEHGLAHAHLLVSKPFTSARTLWAMEQSLRSGACAAVLAWAEVASMHALRRLKLAVNAGGCFGLLFRSPRQRVNPSPATLRLALSAEGAALVVELVKIEGGRTATVRLSVK
jgi:cell division inhibitor SulA/protein ImuA